MCCFLGEGGIAGPLNERIIPVGIQSAFDGNGLLVLEYDFRMVRFGSVPVGGIFAPRRASVGKIESDCDLPCLQLKDLS